MQFLAEVVNTPFVQKPSKKKQCSRDTLQRERNTSSFVAAESFRLHDAHNSPSWMEQLPQAQVAQKMKGKPSSVDREVTIFFGDTETGVDHPGDPEDC